MQNNNNRREALKWWRSLSLEAQLNKARKHFPDHSAQAISASSMRIEQMWKEENP